MPPTTAAGVRSSALLILTCSLATAISAWSQTPDPIDEPDPLPDPPGESSEREPGLVVEAEAPERPAEDEPSAPPPQPVPPDPDFRYETSSLAFPTPPEFFSSLSKGGGTRWRQLYRPPIPDLGTDRYRSALGLGTVFADLFLTAEATDVQHLRNTGQDAMALARGLGVGEHLAPLIHELGIMAEEGKWDLLRQRLQLSLDDLSDRLHAQRDDELAVLIDLGMWLRVLEIGAQVVVEDEEFEHLELSVGSVKILMELRARHAALGEAARGSPEIGEIGTELSRLVWRGDGRSGMAPKHEDVEASYIKIRNLLRRILQRA